MALTKASLFCRNALKREFRLSEPRDITPVPYGKIVTQEHVQKALRGYASSGSLKKSDISECISLLEQAESKGSCKNIANYIATEIIPIAYCEGVNLQNITTTNRVIIESSMEKNKIYDRIIQNQSMLEKRFKIDGLCKGKSAKDATRLLCESIDTYDVPLTHKFNVALENVMLSLVKNNVPFESDMQIANYIVEYFVNRDSIIYDCTYKNYQRLLEESDLYDISEANGYVAALLKNNGNYYGDKITRIFNEANDERLVEFAEQFNSVVTESDVVDYITALYEYVDHNQVTVLDRNRIYYSIDNLTNHSGVSPSFIKMTTNSIFGDEFVSNGMDLDFPDKSEDIFASIPSIDNILIEIQVAQCKDVDMIEDMYGKILSKPATSVFGKIADIITCVRNVLMVTISEQSCSADAICKATLKLIQLLYAQCNNFAMVSELNNTINRFIFTLPEAVIEYPETSWFFKELHKLVDVNSDTSVTEETDIYACFNNDTEVIDAFTRLALAAESTMHKQVSRDALDYIVEVCADNGWVAPLYEAYTYLDAPSYLFESAYNKVYDNKTMKSFSDITNKIEAPYKQGTLESLFLTIEATELFESLDESFTAIEEANNDVKKKINMKEVKKKGTNFITTLKLGLQVLKKKAQKFDTKQKEMWRTLDAYGNKFTRILEEDDDKRRAQLIQGQAVPSFSKCVQSGIGLIVAGVTTGNIVIPIITAFGLMGTNKFLNDKQRKQLIEEIEIELKIVEKQIDLAEKDDDLRTYRQLLMVQRKLQHEVQRLRFKRKPFRLGGK